HFTEIRFPRGNVEEGVVDERVHYALAGRLLGEDDSHFAAIGLRLPVGRVVHLENQIAAGLDQTSLTRPGAICIGARSVHGDHFGAACQAVEHAGAGILALWRRIGRRDEGRAGLNTSHKTRSLGTREQHYVMHNRAIAWTNLDLLDPLIFAEAGGNDEVSVVD